MTSEHIKIDPIYSKIDPRVTANGVPSLYARANIFAPDDFEGNDKVKSVKVADMLKKSQKEDFTFPNTFIRDKFIGYGIIKAFTMAGKRDSIAVTLSDIVNANDIVHGRKPHVSPKTTEDEVRMQVLMDKPRVLFITDFVSENPEFDDSNFHKFTFGSRDYKYLNDLIVGRLSDESLITIFYSVTKTISHCWSPEVMKIFKERVTFIV